MRMKTDVILHLNSYVFLCRKELVAFDRSQSELTKGDTLPVYAGLLQNYDGDVTKGNLNYYIKILQPV